MDNYKIIAPPFTLKFREMSKQELVSYNEWFLAQILGRTKILENAVKGTSGFENWKPDFTPESLDMLGKWFAMQVEVRERTEEEMKNIYDKAPERLKGIEYEKVELTNKTFSLAIDIGMYISQVFLHNIPTIKWQHATKGIKDINYGQPVLAGFGKIFFNPVHMMVVLAYGIAHGKEKESGLRERFEIWKKFVA